MKKLFTSAFLISVLFLIIFPLRLHAAGLTFSAGSVGAAPGDNVVMPINVSGNPGFVSTSLVVYYDPNALEIMRIEAPVADMPLSPQFAHTATPGVQWISFINTNLTDWNGNGTLANIYFKIKPNAVPGANSVLLSFTDVPDGAPGNAGGGIINNAVTISGHVYALQASQSPTPAPPEQPAQSAAPAESQSPAPTPVQIPQAPSPTPEPTKAPAPSATPASTPTLTPAPTQSQTPAQPSASPASPAPAPSPSRSPAPGNVDNGNSETPGNGETDARNEKGPSGTAILIVIIGVLAAALISCVIYIFMKKRETGN